MMEIQQKYVDPPHWSELFENGIRDFEIALSDPAFRRRNLQYVDTTRIHSLSQKIVQSSRAWEIRDPRTLHAGIAAIAEICQKEIGLSPTAVVLEFLAGMTNSLDPYTEFMTLNQYNDTNCMITGNFVGLGVELKADNFSLYINRIIPGSPAEKGGLQSLDRILSVDGTPTGGLPLETASNLLQGEAGSYVRLLVQSKTDAPGETVIRREHLKVPSVETCISWTIMVKIQESVT
jgi:carboxyl-terminal processing protease